MSHHRRNRGGVNLLPILIALIPVTWAVMAAAGKVTQKIMDKGEKHG